MLVTKKNKIRIFSFIVISLMFVSCKNKVEISSIPSYKLIKTDYVDKVIVEGIVEAAKTTTIACPRLQGDATIVYLVHEGTYVKEGDTVCVLQSTEMENKYTELEQKLEDARAEYNKSLANLELQYIMLQAQVKIIEAQTAITELDSVQLNFSTPIRKEIINLQMEMANVEKNKLLSQLSFLERINKSELHKLKIKIKQYKKRAKDAKEKLDELTLTANASGMVIHSILWTSKEKVREGDIVWGRMPLVQIPNLSKMQVNLLLNEASYKRIERNQDVEIQIDAFPEIKVYGKIIKKATVGKPVKKNSKIKVFEVVASIDSTSKNILPGLSATCNVIINKQPDTLIIPLVSVFEDDSIKYVYRQEGKKYAKNNIKIGESNRKIAIIISGIKENDVIALTKPPLSLIKTR